MSVRWDVCVLEPADRETGAPELQDRTAQTDFSNISARADVFNEFAASAKNEWFAFLDQMGIQWTEMLLLLEETHREALTSTRGGLE